MAHKTLINGTAYGVKGGKTKINSTNYSVKQGKTLIGGTNYTVGFAKEYTETLSVWGSAVSNYQSWSVLFWGSTLSGFSKSSGNSSQATFTTAHPIQSIKSIRFAFQETTVSGIQEKSANSTPSYTYNGRSITATYAPGFVAGNSAGSTSYGGLTSFRHNCKALVYITYLSEE